MSHLGSWDFEKHVGEPHVSCYRNFEADPSTQMNQFWGVETCLRDVSCKHRAAETLRVSRVQKFSVAMRSLGMALPCAPFELEAKLPPRFKTQIV